MKKALLTMSAALLLAGCGTKSADTGEGGVFKAGTYTASAAGRNSEIKVTATFTADAISEITYESEETPTIGVPAMDSLIEQIVSKQTLAVDNVSGATMSCEGFMSAMRDTVTQAGADPDALGTKEESASKETEYETEADIIVVGAGAAGMSAAITATDAGAKVIVLEKSGTLGGNTVCAANGINAADADVQKENDQYNEAKASVDGLIDLQSNNPDAKPELVKAFAENSGETINWLSSLGVDFEVDIQNDERNEQQNYYMLKAEESGTTAITMISHVSDALKEKGITVYYNMDAYQLVLDNGKVTGVRAKDESGKEVTFSGKVLLATGGFGQNSGLVGKYNEHLANAVTDEVAPTTGEGLLMALEAGADTANMDAIQTFPAVIPGYGMILPFSLPGGFVPDALYVNNSAERFTAEGFEIPDAILAQDKGEVYCIFDESGMNDVMQGLLNSGIIFSGENAADLAGKLGIDGAKLEETIAVFNEDIADGKDDAFGREQNLNPIEGTLYGYRFGVGAHYFMGGILINENTEVLNTEGNPIEGLYAAGEVTGGFHGTFRVDGSGLGDSFTFGRIAGRVMAEASN